MRVSPRLATAERFFVGDRLRLQFDPARSQTRTVSRIIYNQDPQQDGFRSIQEIVVDAPFADVPQGTIAPPLWTTVARLRAMNVQTWGIATMGHARASLVFMA